MLCGILGRILVYSFSLVWFKPGKSLVNTILCRLLSMLPEPRLLDTLKLNNTQFT